MSTVFATAVANEEPGRKIGTTSVPDVIALFSDTTVTVYECSRLLKVSNDCKDYLTLSYENRR